MDVDRHPNLHTEGHIMRNPFSRKPKAPKAVVKVNDQVVYEGDNQDHAFEIFKIEVRKNYRK
jgi:hypothetical protein